MKKIINDIEKYLQIYKRDGVVKIPSLFTPKKINELRVGFFEGLINSHKIKKFYKYNYIVLAIISNTEEFIQDKNGFFLHQKKLRM